MGSAIRFSAVPCQLFESHYLSFIMKIIRGHFPYAIKIPKMYFKLKSGSLDNGLLRNYRPI